MILYSEGPIINVCLDIKHIIDCNISNAVYPLLG